MAPKKKQPTQQEEVQFVLQRIPPQGKRAQSAAPLPETICGELGTFFWEQHRKISNVYPHAEWRDCYIVTMQFYGNEKRPLFLRDGHSWPRAMQGYQPPSRRDHPENRLRQLPEGYRLLSRGYTRQRTNLHDEFPSLFSSSSRPAPRPWRGPDNLQARQDEGKDPYAVLPPQPK